MRGLLCLSVGAYSANLNCFAATADHLETIPSAKSASIQPVAEGLDCSLRKDYLERHLQADQLGVQQLLARLVKQNFQAIYIGTSHNAWDTESVARILHTLHHTDGSFNCFALEADRRCQEGIDSIVSGKKTFEEAAQTASKICGYSYVPSQKALFDAARNNGIRVFAVDDLSVGFDEADGLPTQSVATTMPRRNEAMAQAVATLLHKGTCRKILGLSGGAHVIKGFYDEKEPELWGSIPDRLRLLGISVAPVNLISRVSSGKGSPLAPEGCSWNLWDKIPAGSAPLGFIPRSPAPPVRYPLYPYGNPATLPYDLKNPINWDEYKGVVVVP